MCYLRDVCRIAAGQPSSDMAWKEARLRWPVFVFVAALGACTSYSDGPTAEQRRASWDAGNVAPTNYRAEVLAYLRTYLNEPSGVREAGISEPALRPVAGGDRYVVCVRFNARKAAGGYTGMRDRMAIFVAGKLDRFVEPRVEGGNVGANVAGSEACRTASYGPFPELERLTR